jgi:hypothetical protein
VGGRPTADEHFETGAFGAMTGNEAPDYGATLIEMKNCNLES